MVVGALAVSCASAQAPAPPPIFPMAIGTTWTYRGESRWTDSFGHVQSQAFTWRMEIVDYAHHGATYAALVRGAPMDLPGFHAGQEPRYSLILRRGTIYYFRASADSPEHFLHFKHRRPWPLKRPGVPGPLVRAEDAWFTVPLTVGQKTCAVPPAPAPADAEPRCWTVERKSQPDLRGVKGAPSNHVAQFDLAYRVLPDYEFVSLVPGLGIAAYHYQHQGTVADTRLRLVEFRIAPPPR